VIDSQAFFQSPEFHGLRLRLHPRLRANAPVGGSRIDWPEACDGERAALRENRRVFESREEKVERREEVVVQRETENHPF
jgi:hypothetical protein